MSTIIDDADTFGRVFVENGMKSALNAGNTAQDIALELADYTRSAFDAGSQAFERIFAAQSLEAVVDIQTAYSRSIYEGFVAETAKLSGLYADMAKDAYKPFEAMVAKAR